MSDQIEMLHVYATDRDGVEFLYDYREVIAGSWASDDMQFEICREADEQGFINIRSVRIPNA